MNYKLRTNKAFTLIELVVAVALLAMVLAFASVIFKVGIESYRTSSANAEIMQKLRAITDQLNTDFKDIQKDAPLLIWFFQDASDPNQRYDQIMFFADGDFQSTQLYLGSPAVPADTGIPVRGNVARIYYGQAMVNLLKPWQQVGDYERDRILARRQHILTADPDVDIWPDGTNNATINAAFAAQTEGVHINDIYEHDSLSLSRWKTLDRNVYGAFGGTILNTCFSTRGVIDLDNPRTFHRLVCEGVGSFAIQWTYLDPAYGKFFWFPSDDPDGNILTADSHFDIMDYLPIDRAGWEADFDAFGAYFNIDDSQMNYWGSISFMKFNSTQKFLPDFYPRALKFTFTLYDSKGILEEGRTFTHIVYIGD